MLTIRSILDSVVRACSRPMFAICLTSDQGTSTPEKDNTRSHLMTRVSPSKLSLATAWQSSQTLPSPNVEAVPRNKRGKER